MKLVFLIDCIARWGGTERILVDKMNYFARMRYDVFLITTNQGKHPYVFELDKNIRTIDLNIQLHLIYKNKGVKKYLEYVIKEYRLYRKLWKQISLLNPDIITCTIPSEFYRLINTNKFRSSFVIESHMSNLICFNYKLPYFLKTLIHNYDMKILQKANCIVALTEGDAKEWHSYNNNVAVIPNIVHLNKSSVFSDYSQKHVIFVGRLTKQKGITSLLEIWNLVHHRHADWVLDIYGDGEMKEWLIENISEKSNVVIHEPTPDIFQCYTNSSILVVTSEYEPFGLVILEAMGCGLPVVSFDCPYGPRDIITDEVDGYLVKAEDCLTFTDKVCYLIEHPEERRRMGKNAINSVQKYKPENIMPRWIELYESLTNRNMSENRGI